MATDPVNTPISLDELLVRNIYATSQYSDSKGLKKNRFYPNYKRESRYYKGFHTCRVSVQRLCHAKWDGVTEWAEKTRHEKQTLIGFEYARAGVPSDYGFGLEPAANVNNPYHAHIYFKDLDKPFPQLDNILDEVMDAGLRRAIDEMTERFGFMRLEEIGNRSIGESSGTCDSCLNA